MKIVAMIPARMASTRFPGKPLASIKNLSMIEHVRRRTALATTLDAVYVATCDQKIFEEVTRWGGKAIMTHPSHERCTDRISEASCSVDADIIVIIQGDEPLVLPTTIDFLVESFLKDESTPCINLITPLQNESDLKNPDIVKAVLTQKEFIFYYSRTAGYHKQNQLSYYYRQTGLSAFRKSFLQQFSKFPPTPLEVSESIDFLRILEHQCPIKSAVQNIITCSVDRPEHIFLVENILRQDIQQKEIYQKIIQKY